MPAPRGTGHPCSRWGQPQGDETVSWDLNPHSPDEAAILSAVTMIEG